MADRSGASHDGRRHRDRGGYRHRPRRELRVPRVLDAPHRGARRSSAHRGLTSARLSARGSNEPREPTPGGPMARKAAAAVPRPTSPRRRRGSAAPLGPAHPGARPHAGGLRGARGLPAAARLSPGAHAPGAGPLRAGRAPHLRPAQHPLHLGHGDRRVGARQAHPLLPAHRQRRALGVGLRLGGPPPSALRALARGHATAWPAWSGMRGAVSPKAGLFEQAAREIKDILVREGVAGMPLGHRRGGAAVPLRAPEGGHRGARRPAGDAGGARASRTPTS